MIPVKPSKMIVKCLLAIALCCAALWIVSCRDDHRESDEQLREQTAHATEQAKKNAQEAAADARVAAANAERKLNDIAAGVKQGLHNGKDSDGRLDVNSASRDQLLALPGITPARAQHIIDSRPYSSTHDLVRKGAISEGEYGRISGQIVAY